MKQNFKLISNTSKFITNFFVFFLLFSLFLGESFSFNKVLANNSSYSNKSSASSNASKKSSYNTSSTAAPQNWELVVDDKDDDFSYIQDKDTAKTSLEVDWLRYIGIACIVLSVIGLIYTILGLISLNANKKKRYRKYKK